MIALIENVEEKIWWRLFAVIASVVAFLYCALLNGYPLIFPDTGTYLYSGFAHFVPVDRPIFYGIFLRHISLAWSLWLPVIVQSLIAYYLIFQSFRQLAKSSLPFTWSLLSAIVLSFFS